MNKAIKAFHVVGVVLFLGSILGHAIVGLAESVHDNPQNQLVGRQIIDVATWYLTVPGLVLLAVTGIAMIALRGLSILKVRWTLVHVILATLILFNAAFLLLPVGQSILEIVNSLAAGKDVPTDALSALEGREALFGAVNIILGFIAVFIGVIRPRLGRQNG